VRFYTQVELMEVLEIDTVFLGALEREEIIERDAPGGVSGDFSARMLERARVASNLVHELDVNLPGVAIIVRMREDVSDLKHQVERLLNELRGQLTDR